MNNNEIKPIFREYSESEVTNKFLNRCHDNIEYWLKQDTESEQDRMEGLMFSTLSLIDGCNLDMPRFILAPNPHPEDKNYYINEEKSNYYPENHMNNINCDIGGGLHDLFYIIKKERDGK